MELDKEGSLFLFLFIHGLPGSGKYTIAKELSILTGLNLFHNHLVVDTLLNIFPFGSAKFVELREKWWLEAFQAMLEQQDKGSLNKSSNYKRFSEQRVPRNSSESNNLLKNQDQKFLLTERLPIQLIRDGGGHFHFIGLDCNNKEIEKRIGTRSGGKLTDFGLLGQLIKDGHIWAENNPGGESNALTLDVNNISPKEAAAQIVDFLKLQTEPSVVPPPESNDEIMKHVVELQSIKHELVHTLGSSYKKILCFQETEDVTKWNQYPKYLFKKIHFMRHAEGEHNARRLRMGHGCQCPVSCPYVGDCPTDPKLTEKGRKQAKNAQKYCFSIHPQIIVVSSLTRAIETAIIAFESTETAIPMIALEEFREKSGVHVCDKRRTVDDLQADFPNVDFSIVKSESNDDSLWKESREPALNVALRAYRGLLWIRDRPEENVVVTTHSSFLLTLFQAVMEPTTLTSDHAVVEHLLTWFNTCEVRSLLVGFEL